jgi:hypothetical protein
LPNPSRAKLVLCLDFDGERGGGQKKVKKEKSAEIKTLLLERSQIASKKNDFTKTT